MYITERGFPRYGPTIPFTIWALVILASVSCATGIRGSRSEALETLHNDFPIGTPKSEVISKLKSNYGVQPASLQHYAYANEPLLKAIGNREIEVYSWIKAHIDQNRTLRRLFVDTTVSSSFFFDKHDSLNGLEVRLFADSL